MIPKLKSHKISLENRENRKASETSVCSNGLLSCPCGIVPSTLNITDSGQGGKWADASGDCCGCWEIEFRTEYNALDSAECMVLAIEAWNEAPRAG